MFESDKNFYTLLPDGYHATGDIWMRLPSFGLVHGDQTAGLIVTPACDLANCKTETVTYVPIVPITQFLSMPEFRGEVAQQAAEQLKGLGLPASLGSAPEFDFSMEQVIQELNLLKIDKKQEHIRLRCRTGIDYLEQTKAGPIQVDATRKLLSDFMGGGWDKLKNRIVRNSYRSDIYYLPADGQNNDWSAVSNHSVALLRYLITVPTFFLDEAHRADERDWSIRRDRLLAKNLHWCHYCDKDLPPLRTMRLRDRFLSDLLTKIVGLYVRLGAPDIDPSIVKRIESEI